MFIFFIFCYRILRVLSQKLRLEADFSFSLLARLTPGFVGADLMSLTREAALIAVNRYNTFISNTSSRPFVVSIFSEGPAGSFVTSVYTNVV